MNTKIAIIAALAVVFLSVNMGCTTTDGSSGGWVVVGQPESPQPPAPQPNRAPKSEKGHEKAGRNHLRSAYRFLSKGKPDHAIKELEKARRKMGDSFWYYYYMGGAYYFKGMYKSAGDSWRMAHRFTNDYRLRSRLRTCQSFAVHHLEGDERAISLLRRAIEVDRGNRQARELLEDLIGSQPVPPQRSSDAQVGKKPSFGEAKTGAESGYGKENLPNWGAEKGSSPNRGYDGGAESSPNPGYDGGAESSPNPGYDDGRIRDRGYDDGKVRGGDTGRDMSPGGSKGKKGSDKDDRKPGKSKKKKVKAKKIRDNNRFRAYFLIEM